jgi:hypothetical protein
MHYLRNLSGIILLVILAMLSACGGSDNDDDSVSDPCGTVIDLNPDDDFVMGEFKTDDCRFWEIDPTDNYDAFVDEYRITVSGGPVEIRMTSRCFNSQVWLLNTPTSCSNGCSDFDSLVLARDWADNSSLNPTAQINIDLIAGTYLILADGPSVIDECNGYGFGTGPLATRPPIN